MYAFHMQEAMALMRSMQAFGEAKLGEGPLVEDVHDSLAGEPSLDLMSRHLCKQKPSFVCRSNFCSVCLSIS